MPRQIKSYTLCKRSETAPAVFSVGWIASMASLFGVTFAIAKGLIMLDYLGNKAGAHS